MTFRSHIWTLLFLITLLSNYSFAQKDYYRIKEEDVYFRITGPDENLSQIFNDQSDKNWLGPGEDLHFINLNGKKSIWFRIKMPDQKFQNFSLGVHTFAYGFEIYKDRKVIHKYGNLSDSTNYDYFKWHLIPLDTLTHSKYIYFRIPVNMKSIVGGYSLQYFGEKSALQGLIIGELREFYSGYTKEIILGIVLLFISIISMLIFFIRIRVHDYSFLYFSMFSFLGGLTYLDDTPLFIMNGLSPLMYHILESVSLFALPIGILLFIGKLFGYGWKGIIHKLWIAHLLLTLAAGALAFLLIITDFLFFFYIFLVIVDFAFMIVVIYKSRKNTAYNIKPILIAFIIFSLFGIQDLLVILGIIPWETILFGWGLLGLVFSFGYILIKHYMDTYHLVNKYSIELAEKEDELDKLQQENLLSQFEALKSQINPHFLFNTFSTLISVIEENPDLASNFVQQLSNVYRYVLVSKENQTVQLKSELQFLEAYNFLLSKRFGSNLQIINCFDEKYCNRLIPPLTLQLLIENAIKHNVISSKKPLKIEIMIDEDEYLVVKNNLQKKSIVEGSTKIGLQNIINRYQFLCDKKVEVIPNQSHFIVRVPLINEQVDRNESSNN